MIILKLDFKKAFDSIEHVTILKILEKIGFSATWIDWVKKKSDSATTSVLLNGIPGTQFQCKRGVRQGDPLSPLLFVLAADLLQCIVNKAHTQGIFSLPIEADPSNKFPIIQYADDTILIMKASQREIFCLKGLLQSFAESTGLKVNYAKSQMIPLNLSQDQINILANTFGCQIGTLPFTYLGLPLGTTKPRIDDYMPLMDRTERRLISVSSFLTQAGRLQLVNSVLSSLPTYAMCSLKIPIAVLEFIDRARKHCLWRGSEINAKNKSLVAWPKALKPKNKGGLGIVDLRTQNDALLLKHLDKFYNKRDISWVNMVWQSYYSQGQMPHATADKGFFWWRDLLHLSDKFRGVASCAVGNGTSVLFWLDVWNGHYLQEKLPRLFSFAKNQKISVAAFLSITDMTSHFHLPLSEQAHQEYIELQGIIQGIQLREENKGGQRSVELHLG